MQGPVSALSCQSAIFHIGVSRAGLRRRREGLNRIRSPRQPLRIRARAQKVEMADAESRCDFVQRHDRRVAPALLQAADVPLAEAGQFGELTLRFQAVGLAVPRLNFEQVRGLDAQYGGQLRNDFEPWVARTFFEFADVGAVYVGAVREILLRYASGMA